MYIQFECRECGKAFELSDVKLTRATSVRCPECGVSLDSSFFDALQEVCMEIDGQIFDISFSDFSLNAKK